MVQPVGSSSSKGIEAIIQAGTQKAKPPTRSAIAQAGAPPPPPAQEHLGHKVDRRA